MLERGELHDEVVAALAASKELPEGSDGHLADALLDRMEQAYELGQRREMRHRQRIIDLSRGVEATCGLLAGALGIGSLSYVYLAFQGDFGDPQPAMNAANPMMSVITVVLVAMVFGACFHAIRQQRLSLAVLWISNVLLGASVIGLAVDTRMYLDSLMELHYLSPGLLAALAALTMVLTVGAGIAGSVRPKRTLPSSCDQKGIERECI